MKEISNSDWAIVKKILSFVAELPRTPDKKIENIRRNAKKIIRKHEHINENQSQALPAIYS